MLKHTASSAQHSCRSQPQRPKYRVAPLLPHRTAGASVRLTAWFVIRNRYKDEGRGTWLA